MKKSDTLPLNEFLGGPADAVSGGLSGGLSGAPPCRWDEETLADVRLSLQKQLSRLGNLPLAPEDLLGEVLLRLLASDREDVRSPAAYARTILRNLIRDKIRELQRAQRVLEILAGRAQREVAPPLDGLGRVDGPGQLENGEFLKYLLDHTQMTATQEKVIRMIYYDDMTVSEIARALSKNPGTIHRHHHRAIEKLSACAGQLELEP